MIFAPGTARRTFSTMRRTGATHQRSNSAGRQHAGPGVEDLHRVGAGAQLLDQVARRHLDQDVDHAGERFAFAIRHQARGRLVGRAAPGHHVGRDRPRRAAEAEQRDVVAGSARFTCRTAS